MNEPPKKKNPIIGFVGILIILAGVGSFCVFGDNVWPPVVLTAGGVLVLVYALFTGNIKLFG